MPASNEEKYLKSIDGTLKDILKELKKQNRVELLTEKDQAASIVRTLSNGSSIRY